MPSKTSSDVARLFDMPEGPTPSYATVDWELAAGDGRNGSWGPIQGQERTRSLASFKGDLYVGIGAAQAEVWRLSGDSWDQVGGGGLRGSWRDWDVSMPGGVGLRPGLKWVNCLLVDEEDRFLYAGVKVGAQLWRFDGEGWEQVGGLGRDGDWLAEDQDNVYSMAWHDGGYAGPLHELRSARGCRRSWSDDARWLRSKPGKR